MFTFYPERSTLLKSLQHLIKRDPLRQTDNLSGRDEKIHRQTTRKEQHPEKEIFKGRHHEQRQGPKLLTYRKRCLTKSGSKKKQESALHRPSSD